MSDEPKKAWFERTAARAVGFGVLLGLGAGVLIAALNPPSWRFWSECLILGALNGLVVGVTLFLTPSRR